MTGEAHRAVVTDPAVNTQVFLWQEGCIFVCVYIYIYIFFFFFLSFGCAGSSLLCGLFSSFGECRLLSSCRAHVFRCRGFSLWSPGSGAQAHSGVSGA